MNSEQFEYTYNKFKNKKNLISHQSNVCLNIIFFYNKKML